MLQLSNLTIKAAVANQGGAMEADTILKNGRSLKSQMSKGNLFSKIVLFFIVICLSTGLQAQISNELRTAAERGDKEAQYKLGNIYHQDAAKTTRDFTQAVYWYRKAAEQGHAAAQYYLGFFYENGYGGLTKDQKQAVYWYRKAAEQGYIEAQFCLAECYNNGYGVTKDQEQALYWYRKVAEQGSSSYSYVQFRVGLCYHQGIGVTKDDTQAVYWYHQAAKNGYSRAQYYLAIAYSQGRGGLVEDLNTALYWFERALKAEDIYNDDGLEESIVTNIKEIISSLKAEGYSSSKAKVD